MGSSNGQYRVGVMGNCQKERYGNLPAWQLESSDMSSRLMQTLVMADIFSSHIEICRWK